MTTNEKRQEIITKVKAAGVVGAGGAGFPTHVKLAAEADMVLANGASCEPLLASDPCLMERETISVLNGLLAAMESTGASRGMVCLKGKHKGAMAALERALEGQGFERIGIFELGDFYPAGDEHVLVREATGRLVPEGGIPLQVGLVVSNVESLLNVNRALEGRPVIDRYLTVTGEVKKPLVARVPIGTAVSEVIDLAGGTKIDSFKVVVGGPMMGQVISDLATPVTKTTSGIIVLPPGHNIVTGKITDPDRILNLTRVACCQCTLCTELCPRYLLGHHLNPHKIMRQLGSLSGQSLEIRKQALICSECGICEKFACPMMISPREVNARIKRELMGQGLKWTPRQGELEPSPFRKVRYVPTKRLVERLNIGQYDGRPSFSDHQIEPQMVRILLKQHLGAPARPIVTAGQRVDRGDLIGLIPENALGAAIHASIAGRVAAVDDTAVTIKVEE